MKDGPTKHQNAKYINGKAIAAEIQQEVAQAVQKLGIIPGLAVILVGNDPASHKYVSLKQKAAEIAGIEFHLYSFKEDTKEEEILETIDWLNKDTDVHAILIQLPLPRHLDQDKIIAAMDYKKDVDGFHPKNIQASLKGTAKMESGLALGILQLISATEEPLQNKKAVILAKNEAFTKTLKHMLEEFGVSADIAHPSDNGRTEKTQAADIVVIAAGKPHSLTDDMIKEGSILIDVGTTKVDDKIVGDIDPSCAKKAAWISPVPGGVGPMTVAMLLKNTVLLARLSTESKAK